MQGYNLIAVFDPAGENWLMCRRRKEPYLGLFNLVGGKIEPGETDSDAAYRELWEETAIPREAIRLSRLMNFVYPLDDCFVQVYVGRLLREQPVSGEENELFWSDLNHNFFDSSRYAGEGNIGHILEHILLHKSELLGDPS